MQRRSLLCLALLLLFMPGRGVCEAPQGTFRNAAMYVNGSFYDGAPLFETAEGAWFVPLGEISARLGLEEPVLEDGFIDWQGFWMDAESEDFFFAGDTLYAISDLLLDAGFRIRKGEQKGQSVYWIEDPKTTLEGEWAEEETLIAHAMGAIDDDTYTNSLEAFLENYAKGFRVFEVDFCLTEDGLPAAVHDWQKFAGFIGEDPETYAPPTLSEFKTKRILDRYTPLGFDDVVRLMTEHPDMRIVTDTKSGDPKEARAMFQALLAVAQEIDATVLDRIIPQIYNGEMLEVILEVYPWNSVIETMYGRPVGMARAEMFRDAYNRGIRIFATGTNTLEPVFLDAVRLTGCKLFRYTINNAGLLGSLKAEGALWGAYTDVLSPLAMDGVEDWADE